MNGNGDFAKYFDDVNKRLDILTEEKRLGDFEVEVGAIVELENVDFNQQTHTLRGQDSSNGTRVSKG